MPLVRHGYKGNGWVPVMPDTPYDRLYYRDRPECITNT